MTPCGLGGPKSQRCPILTDGPIDLANLHVAWRHRTATNLCARALSTRTVITDNSALSAVSRNALASMRATSQSGGPSCFASQMR
jgi:hypothetical protein